MGAIFRLCIFAKDRVTGGIANSCRDIVFSSFFEMACGPCAGLDN